MHVTAIIPNPCKDKKHKSLLNMADMIPIQSNPKTPSLPAQD